MSSGEVMGDIPSTTGLLMFLRARVDENGMWMRTVDAGTTWTSPGGVEFMCPAGDADCKITLTVADDDSITGTWTRAEDDGGTVTAMFLNPFANMNPARLGTVVGIIQGGFAPAEDDTATTDVDESMLLSYVLDADPQLKEQNHFKGAKSIDDVMLVAVDRDGTDTTTASFDPNSRTEEQGVATLTVDADDPNGGAVGRMGWKHRILHEDWGDTGAGADAGIETIAAIYSNIDAPMEHPFADAMTLLAHETPRGWFTFNADGDDADTDVNDDAVAFSLHDTDGDMDGHQNVQVEMSEIIVEDHQASALGISVSVDDVYRGTYFGAAGKFTCVDTAGCRIMRTSAGDTNFTIDPEEDASDSDNEWKFDPDADAVVMLPDQDWLAFGFWLTAPDNPVGIHRLGVFYDGMDMYPVVDTLTGTAEYAGAATGYYVNGDSHGMFTASAMLTANFGADTETGSLSGSIGDFVDSRGRFIDSDNRADPNDPNMGGEGDWTVILDMATLDNTGGLDGVRSTHTTSGTADGVRWTGTWDAQLYGGGDRADPAVLPSGVAGDFMAITADLLPGEGESYKGVVGAFGAEMMAAEDDGEM